MKGLDFLIEVKAPGKLYIAGEYAVVETGYPAILVALDQFVRVKVAPSEGYGTIYSQQYKENSIHWKRKGNKIVFDNRDNPFHYILSAIKLTEEYAQILHKDASSTYNLTVDSELDSPDGKKYGLGSSAAVTVATAKALCKFYGISITKSKLFKLAAIAHFDVQGNGSLGDIAASVYGGWIAYNSFDRNWLQVARRQYSLQQLLNIEWPKLKIVQLTPPEKLQLLIGWTGSPASTSRLVDAVSVIKAQKHAGYSAFLHKSRKCIRKMIAGFEEKDLEKIKAMIRTNRKLLQDLAEISGVPIETDQLKRLISIAEKFHAAAKTSGAGGGDCGIAITAENQHTADIIKEWNQAGIEPLNLKVHSILD